MMRTGGRGEIRRSSSRIVAGGLEADRAAVVADRGGVAEAGGRSDRRTRGWSFAIRPFGKKRTGHPKRQRAVEMCVKNWRGTLGAVGDLC
jgi:hypothetical protein